MLVNATEMLQKARDGHYAVGQFNINNLEWTKAALQAAQEMNSPIILGVSEGAGKYMTGFKTVAAMVKAMIDTLGITVPVALHLDHGSYEGAKACVEAGFSSIMFDGSHYAIDENVAKTTELVALAHENGLSIEAEVGSIGGEEDGVVAWARLRTPPSVRASLPWASTSWPQASATSTVCTVQLERPGLRRAGEDPQRDGSHSPCAARRHRHPRRYDQKGHQPGCFQDQCEHRMPARLRQGHP